MKELEDMLSDVYTTSQFVDTALDSGTDTQLILVKKQVMDGGGVDTENIN